jgi:hypothetical protein
VIGDRAIGDRAIGDRAIGDRAIGDRAIGDRVIGDLPAIHATADWKSPITRSGDRPLDGLADERRETKQDRADEQQLRGVRHRGHLQHALRGALGGWRRKNHRRRQRSGRRWNRDRRTLTDVRGSNLGGVDGPGKTDRHGEGGYQRREKQHSVSFTHSPHLPATTWTSVASDRQVGRIAHATVHGSSDVPRL